MAARLRLWMLRFGVIVMLVTMTGVLHVALDAGRMLAGVSTHETDDCGHDGKSDHCPADCPNCHCTHGAMALPSRAASVAFVPVKSQIKPFPHATDAPRDGVRSSVFRPPRHLAS